MPRVAFVNVTKRFAKVLALNHISFDIENGEYLCVLGPTGSGKTTLLRLVAGLLEPDEGSILFDAEPVNDVPPYERNAVYVPQQYALFPHLTVLENVAFGPLARGKTEKESLEIANRTLDMVKLLWRAESFPSELSGGMQQRVALARGLAAGANLLLLDEPLGALDARLRLDLRHKLRQLVKEAGVTAVHVTHDRDEAMSVADRILVLREGGLTDHGTPSRVYTSPTGIFVANMIGGANFLEGIVEGVTRETCIVRVRGGLTVTAAPTRLSVGEPVVLAIRKEKAIVARSNAHLENNFDGEIRAVRFLGSSREHVVRLTNGDVLVSRRFLEGPQAEFSKEERVSIGFGRDDIMLFPYPSQGLRKELELM